MRPLRLDLAGFAVFREPTTLDFTDADFFALVGPTGSGKSTVLDAICFALYGTVPRWGDRRAIGNALAPSATEARVRLCFESANTRYVVTRVVRRDGKGAVATKHAGLEALPSGFDLASLDLAGQGAGLPAQELGEVLAGTPAELEAAVSAVVGLPYEQFTKCVVLPQGDFAAFLHAKPAERQRILVNLLGLDVYGKIRERANVAAAAAEAKAAVASSLLDSLADAGDAAIEAAERRVAVIAELVTAVDSIMPELAATKSAATEAAAQLSTIEGELSMLASLRPPKDVPAVTAAVTQTRSALAEASELVTLAEEREEKLRAELA
ncbi:MAG: SMC family ATPase, partial [Micromonosporaceae bacterium]|nr:SMC family ATPase [Micromonosporaceae bacterium]